MPGADAAWARQRVEVGLHGVRRPRALSQPRPPSQLLPRQKDDGMKSVLKLLTVHKTFIIFSSSVRDRVNFLNRYIFVNTKPIFHR